MPGSSIDLVGLAVGLFALVYLVPSFVAVVRRRSDLGLIFGVNLLLGWTIVGWVLAMVWAVGARQTRALFRLPSSRMPCPSCGRSLRKEARKCRSCGYTLSARS